MTTQLPPQPVPPLVPAPGIGEKESNNDRPSYQAKVI